MALDGLFLRHIKNEIEQTAIGARVSQIYQPNKDEIIIALRTTQGNKKLLLSARANSPRVHFCSKTPENPSQPPMFCMLLRKRMGGGKLIAVRQKECDRILFIDFECVNELGDTVKITVVCEIMGMYSNIIITDSNNVIIDALKRVDMTMSSRRLVLPNILYELPESQNKLNILNASANEILSKVQEQNAEMALNKALLYSIEGISPIIARELEFRICEGVSNRFDSSLNDKFIKEIDKFKELVKNYGGTPFIVFREDNKPLDFSFMKIEQYGSFAECKSAETFSQLLDEFYGKKDERERMRVKSQDLSKLLSNLSDRISRKLSKQKIELKSCTNREHLRICGDLLQANLYRIAKGSPFADVENFYDADQKIIRIKLNPAISPAANAQKYYKDYQKAKNAEHFLNEQLKKGNIELEYIDSVADTVNRAESEKELAQIREELGEQGYIKASKGKRKKPTALSPLEFISSDGFKILVGRNNQQNDKLTLKIASKNDIWLHTKDIHGSHTIIISNGEEVPDSTLVEAARLAAYHSKAQHSNSVPVDYTKVRFVSKPSGAKPGMVIYVNNKTLYVSPCASIGSN